VENTVLEMLGKLEEVKSATQELARESAGASA
jgi:hypothetical protein